MTNCQASLVLKYLQVNVNKNSSRKLTKHTLGESEVIVLLSGCKLIVLLSGCKLIVLLSGCKLIDEHFLQATE